MRRSMLVLVAVALIACAACDKSLRMGPGPERAMAANTSGFASVGTGSTDMTVELWVKPDVAAGPKVACAPDGDTAIRSADYYTYHYPYPIPDTYEFAMNRWIVGLASDGDVWFAVRRSADFAFNPPSPETVTAPLCTNVPGLGVRDGQWHHVAVQRRVDGSVRIWIDGFLQAEGILEAGDLTQRNGQGWPQKTHITVGGSPVIGGAVFSPEVSGNDEGSYLGQVDEARISSTLRYTKTVFPLETQLFATDAATDRLWHFDGMSRSSKGIQYVPDASANPKGLAVLFLANEASRPLDTAGAFSGR